MQRYCFILMQKHMKLSYTPTRVWKMVPKKLLSLSTLILLIFALFGCKKDAEKIDVGIESKIDQIIENNIDVSKDPGLTVLIQSEGETNFRKAYGLANVLKGSKFEPETPCFLGSVSKQFTATAIMILVEREMITVQQHIKEYFPEYPELWKDVTIHHLLTHQSGISDYLNDHGYTFEGMTNSDALDYIFENGYMNFEPGTMFAYSNTGYIILAELVEKVSGMPFRDFCEEEIFSPLGMRDTYFVDENGQVPDDMAVGHTLTGELLDYNIRTKGDGGMISTVDDMLIWDNSLNTLPIISQETLLTMLSPHSDMNNGAFYGYGYIIDSYGGFDLPSNNGGFRGIFAYAGRIKEKGFYICLFGNSPDYVLFEEVISTSLGHYFDETD